MANIAEKIFGTHSDREIKRIRDKVDRIEALSDTMHAMTDEELKALTPKFKARLQDGETLDDILPEAFAAVREASVRTLGQRHYRVQLIGGIILHQGCIAEMKTGEGKTLAATCPAYLNALTGKGVHIVTVNDYLAGRDAEWMGKVYRFLGLSVGCIQNYFEGSDRKNQYARDITYVTNNELGFDYLRDNMAVYKEQLVLRGLNYAIIDEADSVLIDEARTPLIISGQPKRSSVLYEKCNILAKRMVRGEASAEFSKINAILGEEIEETGDFIYDEKEKNVVLTEEGIHKVEEFFRLDNLADPQNREIQHCIILALRANYTMHRDKDYIVRFDDDGRNGQVLIVDEFTGRVMPGRRYSDGLHQAIEAKEGVNVKQETRTLATITFQNFFNKFEKKAGMTGTAQTEEKEFRNIYGMDVIVIPTNVPVIRKDLDDAVFKTEKEKFNAVVNEVVRAHEVGQPILVGTVDIDTSEHLSKMLDRRGIKHNVLNAKNHEKEAEIVEAAGQHGAVTIATNMAGRGTDIKLDDEARAAGGLKILGTERHESRRIDNQLRGRSGRQGDPGDSRFYLSLEDKLLKLFGADNLMSVFNSLGVEEGEEIHHKMLSKAIENAQKKIESNNFAIRSQLLKFDEVNNEQRDVIYAERRKVLDGVNMRDVVIGYIQDVVDNIVDRYIAEHQDPRKWNIKDLMLNLGDVFLLPRAEVKNRLFISFLKKSLKQAMKERIVRLYEGKLLDEVNMHDVLIDYIQDIVDDTVDQYIAEDQDPGEWKFKELMGALNAIFTIPEINEVVSYKLTKENLKQFTKERIVRLYEEKALDGANTRDREIGYAQDLIDILVNRYILEDQTPEEWNNNIKELGTALESVFPLSVPTVEFFSRVNKEGFKQFMKERVIRLYEEKEALLGDPERMREIERVCLLKAIDSEWMEHIDDMMQLRDSIGLVSLGQKDPLVEYKTIGYETFENMVASIKEDVVRDLYFRKVEQNVARESVAKITGTNRDESSVRAPVKRKFKKIMPNDPCPCGSGKKFRLCHGQKLKRGEEPDFSRPVD